MAKKPAGLSHLAADGSLLMVDVGVKPPTVRSATAQAIVRMAPVALRELQAKNLKKGDAFVAAQIAGTLAAKRTADLIPLCHPLALTHIDVRCKVDADDAIAVVCTVACVGPTGVEMEALTGVAVAALTLYDMCKALDRGITIERIRLRRKSGGRSGRYVAPGP
ncbi:MAG: cyclic pyranopterin monophosphate synthase MoaC [Candidatus Eremiobacteraeota bacterium]|nr:cyclic pyranopterin monophosphate synthase MoaC [Candidatus Eremiobacteraeota bacterium]